MRLNLLLFLCCFSYIMALLGAELPITKGYVIKNDTSYNLIIYKENKNGEKFRRILAAYDSLIIARNLDEVESIKYHTYGDLYSIASHLYSIDLSKIKNLDVDGYNSAIISSYYTSYFTSYKKLNTEELINPRLLETFNKETINILGSSKIVNPLSLGTRPKFDLMLNLYQHLYSNESNFLYASLPALWYRGTSLAKLTDLDVARYVLEMPKDKFSQAEINDAHVYIYKKWGDLRKYFGSNKMNNAYSNANQIMGFINYAYETLINSFFKESKPKPEPSSQPKSEEIASQSNPLNIPSSYSNLLAKLNENQIKVSGKILTKNSTAYDVLGINSEANCKDIKSAYFKLTHIWHPDRPIESLPGNVQKEVFQLIGTSWGMIKKLRKCS